MAHYRDHASSQSRDTRGYHWSSAVSFCSDIFYVLRSRLGSITLLEDRKIHYRDCLNGIRAGRYVKIGNGSDMDVERCNRNRKLLEIFLCFIILE